METRAAVCLFAATRLQTIKSNFRCYSFTLARRWPLGSREELDINRHLIMRVLYLCAGYGLCSSVTAPQEAYKRLVQVYLGSNTYPDM